MVQQLSRTELQAVVAAAVRAPSVLNSQPWQFHAHDDVIDVWADPDRALVHLDPQGRELLMSCGAALLNLRLALASLGRAETHRLLPDPSRPTWVARVMVGGPHRPSGVEVRLRAAIEDRRASREPFTGSDIPAEDLSRMAEAARAEGARVDVPPQWHRAALANLVRDADRRQRDDPALVQDIRAWTAERAPANAGIQVSEYGPRPLDPTALVRDFALSQHVPDRGSGDFRVEGEFRVLLTQHDSPVDRLRAGQALERVWLEATAAGVSMTLLTQPVEVPELRPWLRDPASAWAWPQALLLLGYGPVPRRTDRRPVEEVLVLD